MAMDQPTVVVNCDECIRRATAACEDCLVTFLLRGEDREPVVVDAAEARAVRLLHGAGLVPELRFEAS